MKTYQEFLNESKTTEQIRMDSWVKKTMHMYSGTSDSKIQFYMNSRNLGFSTFDIDYGWEQVHKARFGKK